jgi:hypothetical protein
MIRIPNWPKGRGIDVKGSPGKIMMIYWQAQQGREHS